MTDPLTTTEGLRKGDVLMVAVKLVDQTTGQDYWRRRFVAVHEKPRLRTHLRCVTLKLAIEPKDYREVNVATDVVTRVQGDAIPQGVSAMLMKLIHTGQLRLDDGDE